MIPDWKPATTTKVPDVTTRGELPRCPSAGAERSGSGKQARQRAKWTSALQGDSLFNRGSSALLDERPTDFFLSLSLCRAKSPRTEVPLQSVSARLPPQGRRRERRHKTL